MKNFVAPVLKQFISNKTEIVPYWAGRLRGRTQTPTVYVKNYVILE